MFLEVRRQLSDININNNTGEEEGGAATGEDGGPAPKRASSDFEDWANLPVDNTVDEVDLYSTRNHEMKDEKDVLGWWREHHGSYKKQQRTRL